ncbi:hypothetical protein [Bradyrhizobium sp. JYMT SZCCT0428]|nr:hypothetical protein [Bradyrhizobium sp. JYMT SZCCT0428]MBR1150078.1 hypothetical protein [Bradyrhizobium sp. JYMT SZCCT0428]
MTPREIMFAVQPAEARQRAASAEALAIATLAAHDPQKAMAQVEKLT